MSFVGRRFAAVAIMATLGVSVLTGVADAESGQSGKGAGMVECG